MDRLSLIGRSTMNRAGIRARRFAGAVTIVAALATALVTPAFAADSYAAAPPEAGTNIPKATVRLGILPYADASFPIIGVKKGFFSDVGISISPADGTAVTEDQSHALLVRGDIDVAHAYPPNMLPTYQTSRNVKQIMFHDLIVAGCMLASPKLKLKTIKDYMAEGKSFDDAIHAALEPLQDKQLASTPVANERLFEDTIRQLSGVTWKSLILDDPKILVAAKAGQIEFAHPSGAPIVFSLIQDGWTRLVCLDDLIANGPKGPDSPIRRSITLVGAEGNVDWINKNPNTVLRYISAVWRTIDAIKADPSLYDIQAPVLNSIAGTSLTGPELAKTVSLFHPYIPYADDANFYEDKNSILYYESLYKQIIGAFQEAGVVPQDVTPDDFIWGRTLWEQLEDYRRKTDALLQGVKEDSLAQDKKDLVAQAKKFYGWHDYLDAYRFALAATQ
jgi:ABC-type nitrate/sulfonate/bicarbonate transport system substrate-binding protein